MEKNYETIYIRFIGFTTDYQIHDARYMMYWMALTNTQYKSYHDSIETAEKEKIALENRTIDFITPVQQPETDHTMQSSNSGTNMDKFCRETNNSAYFSYYFATKGETDLSLLVKY